MVHLIIPLQLLGYYVSAAKGLDGNTSRNLVKACKKKIGIYEKATKMVMKEAVYIQNNLNQIQI